MKILQFLLLYLIIISASVYSEGGDGKNISKTSGEPSLTKFNINKISTFINNNGIADINPNGNAGFEFPKRSKKYAVFTSGFLWGGKVNDEIRVGGSAFRSGLRAGRILNSGVPWYQLQAENPDDPSVRIYRVRPDYKTAALTSEINDNEGTEYEIRAQYEKDWNEWPTAYGAPFKDVDGNGAYNPEIDMPGIPGASQTIWFVANDADSSVTKFLYGSLPLGIEMQVTIWGYDSNSPLGNMLFKKYKIINKSDSIFTDMHFSIWSDPDLGDATNDLIGCDTNLQMNFIYNSDYYDYNYAKTPASMGFTLLQGPIINSEATDTAIFNFLKFPGKKNLPVTALGHLWKCCYCADPFQGTYEGTIHMYNYMKNSWCDGSLHPIPDRLGGGSTKFPLSGNPLTGEGYVDGIDIPPADRRLSLSTGPVNMAPGDTQEVVFAEIAAGGTNQLNNLAAIILLKNHVSFAHNYYKNFPDVPDSPEKPVVQVSELDRQIVLNWGSNPDLINDIENSDKAGYKFQGYNVYQLPSENSDIKDAVKIAVYDIKDNVQGIIDEVVDENGYVTTELVQNGTNSGIERFISIKRDSLKREMLNDGSAYFFAVTAYSYNSDPDVKPRSFESKLNVIKVVPQSPKPGERYEGVFGENIEVMHLEGRSTGDVSVNVLEPDKLTGHDYQLIFNEINNEIFWTLEDVTKNEIIITQKSEPGEFNLNPDGFQLNITAPEPGVKKGSEGWDSFWGKRVFSSANANDFSFEGYNGAIGWKSPAVLFGIADKEVVHASRLKNILIMFGTVEDTTSYENLSINPDESSHDENFSYAYRYLRNSDKPSAKPEFEKYIIKNGNGFIFQDFKKSAPLSVWDNEDPDNPKRLAIGYLENNAENSLLDGRYFPGRSHIYNNTDVNGPSEWLFIFDTDYSSVPNPDYMTDILNDTLGLYPVMYLITANRNANAEQISLPGSGSDRFAIYSNKIFFEDKYIFTTPGVVQTEDFAKEDINKINVFPNPYYGYNDQETSRYSKFVSFTHLPQKANIKIFNLAGQLVRKLDKDSPDQFCRWDLLNDHGVRVASGLFIAYIELPDLGTTKILKVAIIQSVIIPEYIIDVY